MIHRLRKHPTQFSSAGSRRQFLIHGHGSPSKQIVKVQEPLGDDVIRAPSNVDSPTLRGAQELNSASLRGVRASVVAGAGIRWLTMTVRGRAQL